MNDFFLQYGLLSFSQERLWFLDKLAPSNTYYRLPSIFQLHGHLNIEALQKSVNHVIKRHGSLRTTFRINNNGDPIQAVSEHTDVSLEIKQMPNSSYEEIKRVLFEATKRPLVLTEDSLFHLFLIQTGTDEHYLYIDMHHIIGDGISQRIFFNDLSLCYNAYVNNGEPQLPELSTSYQEYSVQQIEDYNSEKIIEQKRYWIEKLAEPRERLTLPADYSRFEKEKYEASSLVKILSIPLSNQIRNFISQENTTVFKFMLSVFDILLCKITAQEDLLVGFPSSGRKRSEIQDLIGMFVVTLVHRARIHGDQTFRSVLESVNEDVMTSVANEEYPFQKIVEDLNVKREANINPLFQVFINSFPYPEDNLTLVGINCNNLTPEIATRGTNYDIELYIRPYERIKLELIYNKNLFTEVRIQFIMEQIECLISQVMEKPDSPIRDHSLVTENMAYLLPDPTAVLKENPGRLIIDDFNRHAEMDPGKVAVSDENETWTYGQLSVTSNRVAHYLHGKNIGRGDTVAILAKKGAALVCSILGTIKSGAAFLIIDPSNPQSRVLHYLNDAKPKFCIVIDGIDIQKDTVEYIRQHFETMALPNSHGEISRLLENCPEGVPGTAPDPSDMLYVIYTSGTTGLPKGIMGTHTPVVNFIEWQIRTFDLNQHEHVSMLSGLGHDPLLRDIFLPLSLGATLHIPGPDIMYRPKELLGWISKNNISVIHYTPAMGEIITGERTAINQIHCLRYAFSGGDILQSSLVRKMKKIFPRCACVNFYGTTETPQAMGYYIANDESPSLKVPIGRGIENSQLLILNDGMKMCGISEPGEIYIRSPHLSLGYLNDEKLTEERFITNPFTNSPADRMYRTGDLGRYLPDGMMEYIGRRDSQVKIRGFRVELGEIEAAIGSFNGIKDCIAVLREDNPGNPLVVAYYVPEHDTSIDIHRLQNHMRNTLPDYMVPAHYIELGSIPLTPNGKINRNALPESVTDTDVKTFVGPRTDVELKIAEIFKDTLKINKVGLFENFFDLGGNSLLAVKLIHRIETFLGKEIPLIRLFKNPTVHGIAEYCGGKASLETGVLETFNDKGSKIPIFYIGSTLVVKKCAEFWEKDRPVYGINIVGSDILFEDMNSFSIQKMASHYADEMIEVNPDRPFYIWSYCLDEIAAFEVCLELVKRGKTIGLLVLLDFARLGRNYSFSEGINDYGFKYLLNSLRIKSRRVYYKIFGQIKEIATYGTKEDRTLYDKFYTPACMEYEGNSISCPVLIFKSLEWKYLPFPSYLKKLQGDIKIINMPYMHLPMYRKEASIKKMVRICRYFINQRIEHN